MGFFSDRCHALIDPATKKQLVGEALEKAKLDPKWPRCGQNVKKAARYCSTCGASAPGGWWKCPSCDKWVGNESNYCWNCKKPMNPATRDLVSGGVWQKSADVFAERFEPGDVKPIIQRGFVVEQGTAAILMDGGVVKDVLAPGRHNLDSLGHRINNWGDPPPRTVILVENGDVVLPLRIESLRSAEDLPLALYTEVAFHFVEKGARDFVGNLLKSAPRLTYKELGEKLSAEIHYAAVNACNTSSMDDLVKDPQRRTQLEDTLQQTLKTTLERYGLEILRVSAADFYSKEYEELRQRSGETENKRRELEFDQRLREMLATDKMQQFKTEKDLAEYVSQLAQERGISSAHREQEMARLRQVQRHELDGSEAAFQMAQEMEKTAHGIGVKLKWDDYTRDKLVKDAEAKAKADRIATAARMQDASDALDLKGKRLEIKRKHYAEMAKILEDHSVQTLIALLPDPDQRKHLLELNTQMQQAGRSTEEILALAAANSPAAAEALVQIATLNRKDLEREFQERKKLSDESAERLERILKSAMETTSEAAKRPGSSTQIVK